ARTDRRDEEPQMTGTPGEVSEADSGPHRKALEINLDPSSYGTFAEIGAGQEVADWFLRAGAASGTVAQTICAYDKAFSDERYGRGTRYVSRERLRAVVGHRDPAGRAQPPTTPGTGGGCFCLRPPR